MRKSVFLLVCFCVGWASLGLAAPLKSLGRFDYWRTFIFYEGRDPVCYMVLSAPPPQTAKGGKRGRLSLMIAHRPASSTFDVVSYDAGVRLDPTVGVTVKADGKSFALFAKEGTAWAKDSATDAALTMALRKAENVIVLARGAGGEKIADDIGLKGSNEAYKTITKACSAPRRDLK